MITKIQSRHEMEKIPEGWSVTDCTGYGGRIHVTYQETNGNLVNRIRIAFDGDIRQFIESFSASVEIYDRNLDISTYKGEEDVRASANTNSQRSSSEAESNS